jgi:Fe-S-cluster containining protein
MEVPRRRFSCTQCGKCCDRAPELLLSEAAPLADVFVFRLMFRLYWLPDDLGTYLASPHGKAGGSAVFFGRKRLLGTFAARKYAAKVNVGGKPTRYTKYLMISALTVDTSPGSCPALSGRLCGIHERRPSACRSVPVHYSRAEALAQSAFDSFVSTAGYECDTSDTAPAILEEGRIVCSEVQEGRVNAAAVAEHDRRWAAAIVRRMSKDAPQSTALPSLAEIEANARSGATTVPMRAAWQIAAEAGIIDREECVRLTELQLKTMGQELALGRCAPDACATLIDMQGEYRRHLD